MIKKKQTNLVYRTHPKLTKHDFVILAGIRKQYQREFYSNKTKFFFSELDRYAREGRVWRNSIMGETRGGKSEVGSTICFVYTDRFNYHLNRGVYDSMDVWDYMKKEEIEFTNKFIYPNQSSYIYRLREQNKTGKMRFGQIHQIDEDKEKIGGIGSYSEILEINNLNNICAKFMQSEIWITPVKLLSRNCPYGLYVYQKSIEERANWCLLYKIDMQAGGGANYVFMGWVRVPLHNDEDFRKEYNAMKNEWIKKEIDGGGDARIEERKKVSKMLYKDKLFSKRTMTGKSFVLTKEQQVAYLENFIVKGKVQRFNEMEIYRIIEEARFLSVVDKIKEEEEQEKKARDTKNAKKKV